MASLTARTLCCLTFLIVSSSLSTSSRILSSNSEKVSLQLYYESLCPYSANFIVNYLSKLVQDDELLSIVDLYLSPWGNARIKGNGTFVCQHGPYECLLNTVEACAINAWPKLEEHFPFIYCIEALVYEGKYKDWGSCFQKLALDSKALFDCYTKGCGEKLELQYAAETDALQPPHKYVPWVVVDGKPLYEDYENYVSYICKAYKGSSAPKACSKLSKYNTQRRKVNPPVCYKESMMSTISERIRSAIAFWMQQMDGVASA